MRTIVWNYTYYILLILLFDIVCLDIMKMIIQVLMAMVSLLQLVGFDHLVKFDNLGNKCHLVVSNLVDWEISSADDMTPRPGIPPLCPDRLTWMWETPSWGDSRHRSEAFQQQPHRHRIGTASEVCGMIKWNDGVAIAMFDYQWSFLYVN